MNEYLGKLQHLTSHTFANGLGVIISQLSLLYCLGSLTPLTIAFNVPYWLGIAVNGGSELTPRTPLTASPYSLNTRSGGSAGDGHSLDAADGDPTDAVFVDNEGKVGIGTIGPAFKLNVQGTNVTSRIADGFVQIRTKIDSTNGIARTGTFSSHPFRITTNDLDWFTIDVNGNVGIGTIGPAFKLDVQGTNVTSRVADGFVQIRTKIDSTNGIARTGTFSSHPFRITTNDLDWFTIDVNGNVGIGTTTPENRLVVKSPALSAYPESPFSASTLPSDCQIRRFMRGFGNPRRAFSG